MSRFGFIIFEHARVLVASGSFCFYYYILLFMIRFIRTIPSTLENNRATCLTILRNACPDPLENHMAKLQMPKYANYFRTGANMCPPEMRNVQGKHNSFIYIRKRAKRGYFYKQRRPRCKIKKPHNREDQDVKLKSHIMLHFIRVYTVCYGKKELQA